MRKHMGVQVDQLLPLADIYHLREYLQLQNIFSAGTISLEEYLDHILIKESSGTKLNDKEPICMYWKFKEHVHKSFKGFTVSIKHYKAKKGIPE